MKNNTILGTVLAVAIVVIVLLSWGNSAHALSTFLTVQGGTGTTSPSGILYGDNGSTNHLNTVTLTTSGSSGPSTFSAGTLNIPQYTGGGGGSGLSTTSPISSSNLLVYSAAGAGSAYGVATSTLTATSPLTGSFTQIGSGGSLGCQTASGSQAGCLSSTDWTTFNNKQSALTFSTGLLNTGGTVTNTGVLSNIAGTGISVSGATGNVTIGNTGVTSIVAGTNITVSGSTGAVTINSSGGGGTSLLTNVGSNTFLNTGTNFQAPVLMATSTTATSTFAGDVWIGSSSVLPNPYLRIGTSSTPFYGRILGDIIDAEYDYNGAASINVANANIGPCAASTYFADGNNPTLGGYYGTFSFLNDGWTNGGGSGCGIGVSNTDKPEAVAIVSPTGEMDFDIASTTQTGATDFNWNINNVTKMKLANTGGLIISTASTSAFTVGAQGFTNPAFQVSASTTNAATGIVLISNLVGGGVQLQATSTATNENISVLSKGAGTANLLSNGGQTGVTSSNAQINFAVSNSAKGSISSTQWTFQQAAANNVAATIRFSFLAAADTALTAGTEAPELYMNFSQNRIHASNTIIALQRDTRITGSTHAFVTSGGVISNTAAFSIDGPDSAGTNATLSTSSALYIPTSTITGTVGTSTAAFLAAATGATQNFALITQGAIQTNSLTAFATGDSAVCLRAGTNILTFDSGVSSCIISSKFVKHAIADIPYQDALTRLMKLQPVSFVYNDTNKPDLGVTAEGAASADTRYAQYTSTKEVKDGHTFNVGDPVAPNWDAITADTVAVVQGDHAVLVSLENGTYTAKRSIEENWQWLAIILLFIGICFQQFQISRLRR